MTTKNLEALLHVQQVVDSKLSLNNADTFSALEAHSLRSGVYASTSSGVRKCLIFAAFECDIKI